MKTINIGYPLEIAEYQSLQVRYDDDRARVVLTTHGYGAGVPDKEQVLVDISGKYGEGISVCDLT